MKVEREFYESVFEYEPALAKVSLFWAVTSVDYTTSHLRKETLS